MGCGENKGRGDSGLLVLIPLMAFFGAVVAFVGCFKHHKHHKGHEGHCEGHCEGHRGHGPHKGHGPHECHGPHESHGPDDDHGHGPGHEDDPMRILDSRFARGEIEENDYLRRREVLKPNS